jgi:DNA-binding CsgD family transcriptional regulator
MKIKASLDERAKQGLPPGKAPYGWKNSFRSEEAVLAGVRPGVEVVEEEKQVLLMIRDLYISGLSLGQIATKLNAEGIKSANGKRWHKEPLRGILLNPFHCGYFRRNGAIIKGQHIKDAFWTMEDWEELEHIYCTRKKQNKPFQVSMNHMLGGLIVCGHCNEPVRYSSEPRSKNGAAYYCGHGCKGVRAPVKQVEKYVLQKVRELCSLDITLEMARQEAESIMSGKYSRPEETIKSLELREKELKQMLELAFDAYLNRKVSEDLFTAKNTELESDLKVVQDELQEYRNQRTETTELTRQLERVVEYVKGFDAMWAELTREERREVLRQVCEELVLACHNGRAKLTVKTFFMPAAEYGFPSYKYAKSWSFGPYENLQLTWVQCAKLRLDGLTYLEIAERRHLKVRTVRIYLSTLTRAVGANTQAEALEAISPYIAEIDLELLDRPIHGNSTMNANPLTEKALGALKARLESPNGDYAAMKLGVNRTTFNSRLADAYGKLGTNRFDQAVKEARTRGYNI